MSSTSHVVSALHSSKRLERWMVATHETHPSLSFRLMYVEFTRLALSLKVYLYSDRQQSEAVVHPGVREASVKLKSRSDKAAHVPQRLLRPSRLTEASVLMWLPFWNQVAVALTSLLDTVVSPVALAKAPFTPASYPKASERLPASALPNPLIPFWA